MDITLIDDDEITWVRRHCRCCHAVLWEVLGDPVGICPGCDAARLEPLGILRFHRDVEYLQRLHTLQYHGACPVDV